MFEGRELINTFTDAAYENAPSDWVHSISATVAYVLLTVAIPATVLRYYRVPTLLALPVLVAARMIPFLYLGYIGVWSLLPWALATTAVYWRWPSAHPKCTRLSTALQSMSGTPSRTTPAKWRARLYDEVLRSLTREHLDGFTDVWPPTVARDLR